MSTTCVVHEPQVRVIDEKFRFNGENIKVKGKGNVLDYLREADVYDSKIAVYNGDVCFSGNFSIKTD